MFYINLFYIRNTGKYLDFEISRTAADQLTRVQKSEMIHIFRTRQCHFVYSFVYSAAR